MSRRFMLVAGEASGDALAAGLVQAMRAHPSLAQAPFPAEFFGAGGPALAQAGVDLSFDLTQHAVFGFVDVLRRYLHFRRLFNQLIALAETRQPDVFIGVDYSGFNRRLAQAIKARARSRQGPFQNWRPRCVQFVSPQVWASRPGRALQLQADIDLLLSIVPFEKDWYARRTPALPVEYVGHPVVDRLRSFRERRQQAPPDPSAPLILLLPGSRSRELARHLPPLAGAVELIRKECPGARFRLVLPPGGAELPAGAATGWSGVEVRRGHLAESLVEASLALASSGTVTTECAYMGVPTVVLYRLSRAEYEIGRRIILVRHIALVNVLAEETIFPEFIQHEATAENLARAGLAFLREPSRRAELERRLAPVLASLGQGGASKRAAAALLALPAVPVGRR